MVGRIDGPWDPALDSAGDPLSGALLYTFDSVATTTPKTSYSDTALTVPHANPIVANSAGRFAQIWAAEGAGYYITLKTAAGVTIASWGSIVALGADATGVIERDEGADGRLKIYADAGVANFEAGDPDPDDVGGAVRIGGWDGTQADTIELDAAAVSVTGNLLVNGKVIGEALSTGTVTAMASADIALPTGYMRYRVELRNIVPASDAVIHLRTKHDGDGAFRNGAAAYQWRQLVMNTTDGSVQSAGDTEIHLSSNAVEATAAAGFGNIATLWISTPSGAETGDTRIRIDADYQVSGGGDEMVLGSGRVVGSAGAEITDISILAAAGDISLDYAVYGEN